MIPFKENPNDLGRHQLEEYLHFFETHPGQAFSYDLNTNSEGITIVTYQAFQRYAVLTLLHQLEADVTTD